MFVNKTSNDVNPSILGDALTNLNIKHRKLLKIHILDLLATTNEKIVHIEMIRVHIQPC